MASILKRRAGTTSADVARIRAERAALEASLRKNAAGGVRKFALQKAPGYQQFQQDFKSKLYYKHYSDLSDKLATGAIIAGGVFIGGAAIGTALGAFGATGAAAPLSATGAAVPSVSATLPAVSGGLVPQIGTVLGTIKAGVAAAGAVKTATSMFKGGKTSPVHALASQQPRVTSASATGSYLPWIIGGGVALFAVLALTG